jgi:hypothetical protein
VFPHFLGDFNATQPSAAQLLPFPINGLGFVNVRVIRFTVLGITNSADVEGTSGERRSDTLTVVECLPFRIRRISSIQYQSTYWTNISAFLGLADCNFFTGFEFKNVGFDIHDFFTIS